jgi:hypothetical protein
LLNTPPISVSSTVCNLSSNVLPSGNSPAKPEAQNELHPESLQIQIALPLEQVILAVHLEEGSVQEQLELPPPPGPGKAFWVVLSCAKTEQLIKIIRHKVGKAVFFMFISFLSPVIVFHFL